MYLKSIALTVATLALAGQASTASAEPDVWHQMLSALMFADTTRASLLNLCEMRPDLRKRPNFDGFCRDTVYHVPDEAIEAAALPYLKACVTEKFVRVHLPELLTPEAKTLTRKLVRETRTGNREPWTPEELAAGERRNASELSTALGRCTSDMGKAAAHAMFQYR